MTYRRILGTSAPVALALCSVAYAQQTTGGVVGTATDGSGAAVPNVSVTLSSAATGFTRTVTSNGSGEYTITDVEPGTYKVTVTAPNYKSFVATGVQVNVATSNTVNAQMQIGGTSETVTVEDTNVSVQTDSAALGQVIDGNQVKELPLNGRSFVELTQLQPGVSAANNFDTKNKGLQGGVDMSVNGNPTVNNLFLIDGVNNNDVGSNRTILIYPSNEAIAEFKMLTNSFGAEYGQASGAIISIVTRSGTNRFHGSAFYDGRNDVLDTFTYFARQNANPALPRGGKDKLRRNDFGYSIGGPIKRDKLFFFFSEEWNREIRGRTVSACVPTAAELTGDFSADGEGVSCSPNLPDFAGAPTVAGNPYKLQAIDPSAAKILQLYPSPTRTNLVGGNNWSQSLPTALYWREENVRADYRITPKNLIVGRYTQDTWTNPSYNAGYWGDDPFPALNSSWSQPSKSMMGRWTSTISDTLVNDAAFQYSNNRIIITAGGTNPDLLPQVSAAVPTLFANGQKHSPVGVPQVSLGNYNTTQNIAPWQNQLDLYSFQDNVSKIFGRNVLKFGLNLDIDGKDEDTNPSSGERPSLSGDGVALKNPDGTPAGGISTGNTLANFLIPGNKFFLSETSTNVRAKLRWRNYEFYATDNFKLTPHVTIDAGLRYSIMPPTYQPNGIETNFQPNLYNAALPATDACNGLLTIPGKDPCGDANKQFGTAFSSGTPGKNKYLQDVNYHLFAPRVGVNWDTSGTGKTVVSAGAGQFFQRERISRYTLVSNSPFAINANNYIRTLGGATPTALTGATSQPQGGYDPKSLLPNSWQWNLTVQQALNANSLFSISYVGNKGTHLTSGYDINQIPQSNWLDATFAQGNAVNTYRPYSNYGSLAWWTHSGNSNFNGLETLIKTRFKNLQMLAAYTWSHSIADIIVDDSSGALGTQTRTFYSQPRFDRGNGDVNRPNNFVANAVYNLPSLAGKNHLLTGALGGWELSGITTAANGNNFTIYQGASENTKAVAKVLDRTVGSPTLGTLITNPAAGLLNGLVQTGYTAPLRPLKVAGQSPTAGRKGQQIVNPNAFTLIGYQLGTIPSNMAPRGYVGGPNFVNTDFSVDKNWKVREMATVQFRLDFFDVFNHANFNPNQGTFTPFQSVNCGAQGADGTYQPCSTTNSVISAQSATSGFGTSNQTIGNASRQIQYTLHINF